jgi:hypothetical protein
LKRVLTIGIAVLSILGANAAPTFAQSQTPPVVQSEETEPRVIGRPGTMLLGFSGFADKFFSSEDVFAANYTLQVDVCRFLTKRFAVRVGAVGSGSFGGDDDEDLSTGSGAPSLHATTGLLYYFTPQSMMSVYVGGEYWAQLTRRADRDTGSVFGTAGIQAAVSSRASFFVQGGVGARMARGDDNELLTRFAGQLGLRIKF